MAATAAVSPSEYLQPAASTAQVGTGASAGSPFPAGAEGRVLGCRTANAASFGPSCLRCSQLCHVRRRAGCRTGWGAVLWICSQPRRQLFWSVVSPPRGVFSLRTSWVVLAADITKWSWN